MGILMPLVAALDTKLGVIVGSAPPIIMLFLLRQNAKSGKKSKASKELSGPGKQVDWREPSSRALSIAAPSASPYGLGWKEFAANPYDAEMNPGGCINLAVAENRLSVDLLQRWLDSHPQATALSGDGAPAALKDIAGYNEYHGTSELRKAMAGLMEIVMGNGYSFCPDNVVITSGASAAVETLAFCLGDPGDAFIVPAPYYPGFDRDVEWRSQVKLVPAHTESCSNFVITRRCLEAAWESATAEGLHVRAVLISSPCNPVGSTYNRGTLLTLLEFAREKKIHVICDEVYAGSVFDESRFVGIVEVMSSEHQDHDRVHIVYGLAKDMGLPGFRVGVLYSWNKRVLLATQKIARITGLSSQTQAFLVPLLSDRTFIESFLRENQRRLNEARAKVVKAVESAGLAVAKGNAGQFVWLDLRSLLVTRDEGGEIKLFKRLVYEAGLNLSAGHTFHCAEPGWFRLCFAVTEPEALDVALMRLQTFAKEQNIKT